MKMYNHVKMYNYTIRTKHTEEKKTNSAGKVGESEREAKRVGQVIGKT